MTYDPKAFRLDGEVAVVTGAGPAIHGKVKAAFRREGATATRTGRQPRLVDSAVGAALNAVINGAIAWHGFQGSASIPLSVDRIGAPGVTALGNSATLAFSLVLIITCITFFVVRRGARRAPEAPAALRDMPFLRVGLRIAIANTLLAFGAFVTAAVVWQRVMGTMEMSPLGATAVVAAVAALATAFAEWRTKTEMLDLARRPREG